MYIKSNRIKQALYYIVLGTPINSFYCMAKYQIQNFNQNNNRNSENQNNTRCV